VTESLQFNFSLYSTSHSFAMSDGLIFLQCLLIYK